jgi:hypothetical protein
VFPDQEPPQPKAPVKGTVTEEGTEGVNKRIQIRKDVVETWRLMAMNGVKQTTPPLIEALNDADYEVQYMAQEGLVALGKKAVKPLLEALKDNRHEEARVIKDLNAIRADTRDEELKKLITVALLEASFKKPGGLPKLTASLDPQKTVKKSLKTLGPRTKADEFVSEGLIKALGGIITRNDSRPLGDGRYSWKVWLEAEEETLDRIDYVVYKLHPTFPRPEIRLTNRAENFALTAEGWGEFEIKIEVHYKDGEGDILKHWLKLRRDYPPGGDFAPGEE